MNLRLFIPGICLLLPCASAQAALDPETDAPYPVQIVVRLAEQRILTAVFKDQVKRELRDGLQSALGAMGQVEVVTEHPLLKDVEAKGLQALDGWKDLSERKTHFVLIDFADDQYVIRTRSHDGLTGLAGPVRQARTTDRQFVTRAAALLIDRDFGLVGTLPAEVKGEEVAITLKGSGLGVPLGRFVKKGEVFAIVQISKVRGQRRATRVPWALLQAVEEPKAAATTLTCKLLQRYKQSLAGGASLLGHRCLKLGTTQAPLRLRLVDDKFLRPLADQAVTIHRLGFESKPDEEDSSDADGFLTTKKAYAHVAFVQVRTGSLVRARIPIEIVDNQTALCPISVNPEAERLGQFDLQRRQWLGQLAESALVLEALFKNLNQLVEKKEHAAALKKAQEGLTDLQTTLTARAEEMRRLRAAAAAQGLEGKLDLAEGEQRLLELQARQEELRKFTANVAHVIQQASDPRRAELLAMIEQARLLEGEAEFGQALDRYRRIVDTSADHPMVRDHARRRLQELEQVWKLKGEAHGQARDFIYATWPNLDSAAQIQAKIDDAVRMFHVCRDAGDMLTPRRLLKANLAHATRLQQRLEALQPRDNDADRLEAEAIVAVADRLRKLTEEATGFLRPKK